MKILRLFLLYQFLSIGISSHAQDLTDILITKNGKMIECRVTSIDRDNVNITYKKGEEIKQSQVSTESLYMIKKTKGYDIFFDEDGGQRLTAVVPTVPSDMVLFLNSGKYFPIYNISVDNDRVAYQKKNIKTAPQLTTIKDDIFFILHPGGLTQMFKSVEKTMTYKGESADLLNNKPIIQARASVSSQKPLLASNENDSFLSSSGANPYVGFTPTPELSPAEIETLVNNINPYTLYRKGSVVDYAFEYKGKPAKYMGGPSGLRQIVRDEKIENGVLAAYISMDILNKKQEPMKMVPDKFKENYFPVEIDINGTYHFTHNPIKDGFIVKERKGYGMLIPGAFEQGMALKCSRIHDIAKGGLGDISIDAEYSNWIVDGAEDIHTPAGTFSCIRLTGKLAYRDGVTTRKNEPTVEYIHMWLARGIGIVRYEIYYKPDYSDSPFIMYLNKADIK